MIEDVTERRQSEALSQCQKRALEMVAQGASLAEVLDFVILAVEKQATVDLRVSILLLDEDGKSFVLCGAKFAGKLPPGDGCLSGRFPRRAPIPGIVPKATRDCQGPGRRAGVGEYRRSIGALLHSLDLGHADHCLRIRKLWEVSVSIPASRGSQGRPSRQ